MIKQVCRLAFLLGLIVAMVAVVEYRGGIVPPPDYVPGNLPPWPKPPFVGPPDPPPPMPPNVKAYTGIDIRHLPGAIDLESTGQFHVMIQLEAPGDAESVVLAKEVQRVLEQAEPENPNRLQSFPTWKTTDPQHPELIPPGWNLWIKRVMRLPHGHWRAVVFVHPMCATKERSLCSTFNHHIEYYQYLNGELELLGDEIDPYRNEGFIPIVRH